MALSFFSPSTPCGRATSIFAILSASRPRRAPPSFTFARKSPPLGILHLSFWHSRRARAAHSSGGRIGRLAAPRSAALSWRTGHLRRSPRTRPELRPPPHRHARRLSPGQPHVLRHSFGRRLSEPVRPLSSAARRESRNPQRLRHGHERCRRGG